MFDLLKSRTDDERLDAELDGFDDREFALQLIRRLYGLVKRGKPAEDVERTLQALTEALKLTGAPPRVTARPNGLQNGTRRPFPALEDDD